MAIFHVGRRKLITVLLMLEFIIFGAASGYMIAAGLDPLHTFLWVGIGGALLAALTVWCVVGGKTHKREKDRINASPDSVQSQYRRAFLFFPISVALLSFASIQASLGIIGQRSDPGVWGSYGLVLGQLIVVFAYALMLTTYGMGKEQKKADDELFARNRLLGQQTGFYIAVGGLFVAYFVGLHSPNWGIALLPSVGGIAVAAGGLRFALLDQAAERDG